MPFLRELIVDMQFYRINDVSRLQLKKLYLLLVNFHQSYQMETYSKLWNSWLTALKENSVI